jgi:hypothetical protein
LCALPSPGQSRNSSIVIRDGASLGDATIYISNSRNLIPRRCIRKSGVAA